MAICTDGRAQTILAPRYFARTQDALGLVAVQLVPIIAGVAEVLPRAHPAVGNTTGSHFAAPRVQMVSSGTLEA